LYERALVIKIRNHSDDGADEAAGHVNIAGFYSQQGEIQHTSESKRRKLLLASDHFQKAVQICGKIYGSNDPKTLGISNRLSDVLIELRKL
jgi:hypothetical protein